MWGSIFTAITIFFCIFTYLFYTEFSSYAAAQKSFQKLKVKVSQLRRDFPGECSFIIRNAKKPFLEISYRQDEAFPAASLIKLPIAAVACKAIKEKKVGLWQVFTINAKDITVGSGIIKTMRTPVRLSFKKIMELMIAQSDNTATNKIIDILGYDYLNKGFSELGLKNTRLTRKMMDFSKRRKGIENYTCASDIAYLLERIYNKTLIDKKSSRIILTFLLKQKMRDRIPRYLPRSVDVAHKTGLEKGVVHDAGIIFSSKSDCLVCVLTKRVKKYSKAKKFIANLSLLTYNNLCMDDSD
ncbi:MAG: serine hydrolase [Candidatus Omnitrophota bacterium]|nr:serine hydrolase [Candidatus Omnitrophota bacterium]